MSNYSVPTFFSSCEKSTLDIKNQPLPSGTDSMICKIIKKQFNVGTTLVQLDWEKGQMNWRWELPVPSLCSRLPILGKLPCSFLKVHSFSPAEGAEDTTWHQSPGQAAEIRMYILGQALSQGFVVRPLSVSPGCLNCHMISPVSSNDWSMCKCCKERLSEEQVRKHMRVRDRKNRDAEMRNNQLWKKSEKEELLWLLWPLVLFSRSGDWAVLTCIWLYNVSQHYPVTQLLLQLVGVGSSSCN